MSTTTTTTTTKATGREALDILTSYQLGDPAATITEHDAYFDVDGPRAGYAVDRESETAYTNVLWQTVLYTAQNLPDGYTLDDLFSVDYLTERNGSTDTKVLWFHIHEDIFDGESRGTHFEFSYEAE